MNRSVAKSDNLINSLSFFRSHWAIWKLVGATHAQVDWKWLYIVYSLILNLLVTVWYPLHLGLLLFRNKSLSDDITNLSIFATCLACSLKFSIYVYKFKNVEQMEQLLKQLDSRVETVEEKLIYSQLKKQLRGILFVFIGIYLPVGVLAEMGFLFQKRRALMYPGWFPFDWVNSSRNYYIAHVYQIVGIGIQIMQNYVNDCFPAMMLCLISAHIQMLYVRLQKVGEDKSLDAEQQLEACITDHKCLLE